MLTAPALSDQLGNSLATDYFFLREQLTESQIELLVRVRNFVDDEVLPVIGGYWERAEMPWPLLQRLGELGIVGDDIQGYGCPGLDPIAAGLVNMELSRGDGSLATFLGVQSGLAMKSIAMLGSEEQKQRWLPEMARLQKLGAFALTEPDHGSDSVALETTATRMETRTCSTAPSGGSETGAWPTSSWSGHAGRTARSTGSWSRRDRTATRRM